MEESSDLLITRQSYTKIKFARALRRRMTEAETVLWQALRGRKCGCKFRRQVALGAFIVDFCCIQHRLIIEVDGGIHAELSESDKIRDQYLLEAGFTTIRFLNEQIFYRLPEVLKEIQAACVGIDSCHQIQN